MGVLLQGRRGVPVTGGEVLHARERPALGALELRPAEHVGELGVGVDDRDHVVGHTQSIPESGRMRADVRAATLQLVPGRGRSTFGSMTALDASSLEIRETKVGGARGLALSGALDVASAIRFTEAVEFAVWGTRGAFVIDLTEIAFLDSTGLHALLRARALLARENRSLALLCPPGTARRVLDLAGTLDTFAAFSSPDALAAALVPEEE